MERAVASVIRVVTQAVTLLAGFHVLRTFGYEKFTTVGSPQFALLLVAALAVVETGFRATGLAKWIIRRWPSIRFRYRTDYRLHIPDNPPFSEANRRPPEWYQPLRRIRTEPFPHSVGQLDLRDIGARALYARWSAPLAGMPDARSEITIHIATDDPFDYAQVDWILQALHDDLIGLRPTILILVGLEQGSWNIATVTAIAGVAIGGTALTYQVIDHYGQRATVDRTVASLCYRIAQDPASSVEIRSECEQALTISHKQAKAALAAGAAAATATGVAGTSREEKAAPALAQLLRPHTFIGRIVRDSIPFAEAPSVAITPIQIVDARRPPAEYPLGALFEFDAILRQNHLGAVDSAMILDARRTDTDAP